MAKQINDINSTNNLKIWFNNYFNLFLQNSNVLLANQNPDYLEQVEIKQLGNKFQINFIFKYIYTHPLTYYNEYITQFNEYLQKQDNTLFLLTKGYASNFDNDGRHVIFFNTIMTKKLFDHIEKSYGIRIANNGKDKKKSENNNNNNNPNSNSKSHDKITSQTTNKVILDKKKQMVSDYKNEVLKENSNNNNNNPSDDDDKVIIDMQEEAKKNNDNDNTNQDANDSQMWKKLIDNHHSNYYQNNVKKEDTPNAEEFSDDKSKLNPLTPNVIQKWNNNNTSRPNIFPSLNNIESLNNDNTKTNFTTSNILNEIEKFCGNKDRKIIEQYWNDEEYEDENLNDKNIDMFCPDATLENPKELLRLFIKTFKKGQIDEDVKDLYENLTGDTEHKMGDIENYLNNSNKKDTKPDQDQDLWVNKVEKNNNNNNNTQSNNVASK